MLFESSYLETAVKVTPTGLEVNVFGDRRVAPFARIVRIRASMPLIASVQVGGGPFGSGTMVPVGLHDKEALIRAVLAAQQGAPQTPMLIVTFVGGHGLSSIATGDECALYIEPKEFVLERGTERITVAYADITALELDGPGETATSLGVSGGGFGLLGAIAGMAAASAANALTTRRSVDTLLTWRTAKSEVILHTSSVSPVNLRVELSEQFAMIERNQRATPALGTSDVVAQIQRLADLRASGVLTEEEFGAAKARLLA